MDPLYQRLPGLKPMFEPSTPDRPTADCLSLIAYGFIADVVHDASVEDQPEVQL